MNYWTVTIFRNGNVPIYSGGLASGLLSKSIQGWPGYGLKNVRVCAGKLTVRECHAIRRYTARALTWIAQRICILLALRLLIMAQFQKSPSMWPRAMK
jgi:hypothetical protein